MKKRYFVNFTNHPVGEWDERQRKEAEKYGEIVDFPFPMVDASEGEDYIEKLAQESVEKIEAYQPCVVLCQGEFTLCYKMVCYLREKGIKVMAACSKRMVTSHGNRKEVIFLFERFREYR